MANKIIEELKKEIEIKNEISKKIMENIKILREKTSQLKIEDFEDLSYEEILYIYENIHYLSSFNSIKKDVEELIEKKKIALYPELKKAIYYPILNTLEEELGIETVKKLDNSLSKMRVGNFIMKNSKFWYPLKNYIEYLVPLGIVERIYEVHNPNVDEYDEWEETKIYLREKDIDIHKKVWNLYEKLKETKEKEKRREIYEEIDSFEVDGYGYLCIGDYEIMNLEKYEKTKVDVIYKLVMKPNRNGNFTYKN